MSLLAVIGEEAEQSIHPQNGPAKPNQTSNQK
jgi:hypothetical protein